jgi:cytoskeletal protein RodZ
MDLPSPNQNEPKPIIPEMNGPLPQEHRAPGMQWLRLATLVVIGLLVLALLFLGGRWTYRKIAHKSTKPTTATTQSKNKSTSKQASGSQSSKTATPQSSSSSSTSPSTNQQTATSSSTGSQTATSTQTGSNGNLTNTGPGSTAAIFTIATATGVIAYQVVLRRRAE